MPVRNWALLVAMLLIACHTSPEAASLGACQPLVPVTSSVSLQASRVVAAGKAADLTLYVVYTGDAGDRLFVGTAGALVERVVIGSGQSGDLEDLDYVDDGGTMVRVEVVRAASGAQMSVTHGPQASKSITPGNAEALVAVGATMVVAIPASTTQTFDIDFAASLTNGQELVVIAPTRAAGYDQFRVFYGPASALAERETTNFGSSLSGQRSATVNIDGASAELQYVAGGPSRLNPNAGPSQLTIGSTPYTLSEGPVPDGAAYLCSTR